MYKMYVFINMVIARVKNGSPDMMLTPFDGKLHEKKMRYLPGLVDLQIPSYTQYQESEGQHKSQKLS